MNRDRFEQLGALVEGLEISQGQLLTMAGEIVETRNIHTLADLREWQLDRLIEDLAALPAPK